MLEGLEHRCLMTAVTQFELYDTVTQQLVRTVETGATLTIRLGDVGRSGLRNELDVLRRRFGHTNPSDFTDLQRVRDRTPSLALRVVTDRSDNLSDVGIALSLNGRTVDSVFEQTEPYIQGGNPGGRPFLPTKFVPGTYTIVANANTEQRTVATGRVTIVFDNNPSNPNPNSGPRVNSLTFVDANTDQDISAVVDRASIRKGTRSLAIRANVGSTTSKVSFKLEQKQSNGQFAEILSRTESRAPFTLLSDRLLANGRVDYAGTLTVNGRRVSLEAGKTYRVTATAIDASGNRGTAFVRTFTVT